MSVYKNKPFGVMSDWLVTVFCIIYIVASFILGNKQLISGPLAGFNVVYSLIIIMVYWIMRNKYTDSIVKDNKKEYESKLTSFRKLMLGLSNVPGFVTIIFFVVRKVLLKNSNDYNQMY